MSANTRRVAWQNWQSQTSVDDRRLENKTIKWMSDWDINSRTIPERPTPIRRQCSGTVRQLVEWYQTTYGFQI